MKIKNIFKNKINYFDLIFGILFISIIVGIYLFFYRKVEYVNIRVKITDQDVLYVNTNPKSWYANQFKIGDKEIDELGKTTSEVTNVETFNTSGDTKAVYLDIKIKAVYNRKTKLYSAKGTGLIFGNIIKFNFPSASFYGLITESPSTASQPNLSIVYKKVTAISRGPGASYNIEPSVFEKIKVGDKITNSQGENLAEVIDIKLRPAQRVTLNYLGDLLIRNDPFYKDATITLKVKVKQFMGDEFVFDNIPLKIGNSLPLNFSYESIWPIIIDIK